MVWLIIFLEKSEMFYSKQFGFRSKHSTDHAVLCIIDKIQRAIDNRNYSCGIFLDFSKAFDTVNHEILIKKLEYYGVRGIAKDWFTSYLSNRRQIVTVNSVTSAQCNVSFGVPQGSVLGPLLFLLYINDFHKSSSLFDFHLFADDSNLFYEHQNISELETNINTELSNVHIWLCANRLSLNIEKSNYVIFHPPQKKMQTNLNLNISDKQLKREYCIKYLGIMIDCNLSWKKQVDCVLKKIRRSIGILSKIRHYVSQKILVSLYYALVSPFLTYGVIAWGNTYESTINPIFILQKKAVRIITFSSFDHHSSPLFKSLEIIKFHDLVSLHISIFMYKFHNHLLPSIFQSFFTKVDKIHSYNTRHAAKQSYYLPKARTNYGKFNIRFQGPTIWNDINEDIKQSSMFLFKKQLKQSFITSY